MPILGVFKMVEMMMSPYFLHVFSIFLHDDDVSIYFSIGQLGLISILADFFGEFPGSTAEHRWSMYSS
jgi:hypothetical protein